MSSSLALHHLELADKHIHEAMDRIDRQKAIIDHDRAAGLDVALAERVLNVFEETLRLFHEHRQTILMELGTSGRTSQTGA